MNKGNFFVKHPIVAMVIAISTVIIGIISLIQLPVEQYPNITPPMVEVKASYTGANAINVEESVATPIEQEVNGVDNMIYMKSINANDGSLRLQTSFEVGTNPDMNTVFTQTNVSAAMARLPSEVQKLGVTTKKTMSNIVLAINLYSDGRYDQSFLANYSIINIQDVLARIKGAGSVRTMGAGDYSMRIWIKPDKMAEMNIDINDIEHAINEQNVIESGGKFGGEPTSSDTKFTYTVRMPERLKTEEEFEEIIIKSLPSGAQVKVKDVADVELGSESYNTFGHYEGKGSAVIVIYQSPGSNAVDLGKEVIANMEELKKSFPEGVMYEIGLDATAPITAGIDEIIETLIIALLLVIFVVYIFIQDTRATLIPIFAIPVSLIGAFILFPLLGFTINVLSLLGLVLAIGIVVDDAIVVVEAVQVKIEKGMNSKDATNAAMKEVTSPIIGVSLVLIAVFIPVASISGITGQLYQQFAITIAVSVFFSAVNALSLSPALCSILLRKPKKHKGFLGKFFDGFNKWFGKTTDQYFNFTSIATQKIKRGLVFVAIIVVSMYFIGRKIPGGFMPTEDQGYFYVNVQLPFASALQRTDAVALDVEKIVKSLPEVDGITVVSGYSLYSQSMSTSAGVLFVSLKDWKERKRTANELIRALNMELRQKVKEGTAFAFAPPAIPGLGTGDGFSIMIQDKGGNSPNYLAANTKTFVDAAKKRPEIGRIFSAYQATVPQRSIELNYDAILKAGIPLQNIYKSVSAFLGGSYVNDFNRFGRLYRVYIQAAPEYRQTEKQIELYYIRNKDNESVPLANFVKIKNISGPEFTNRFNMYRSIELNGGPAFGYSSDEVLNALEEVANETLPKDMGYSWSNISYQQKKASGTSGIIFAISLLFVYLILTALYESWTLPLTILFGTPFAVFGALLSIYIARLISPSFVDNIFLQISLILLLALAAKNAILIIEFAKLKFDEGANLYDAAMEAAKLRFRPILMTAFSFVFGVLPLVLASGAGAESRKVMGVALVGGMLVATIIGVVIYPMFFVLIGKLAKYEKHRDNKKTDN
ncbi:efflux RND transporter permease subunit [Halosquirtibacter xylanolyticus]|uniref:efflux RND transporter permease subunit n=1 Tax=Halosquirtibacter xylanolyticus TaxID=3374599 RepID=UPI003747A967|nr:efflux RND transporter permease subunit [Prolixibacteraceae bacterium]